MKQKKYTELQMIHHPFDDLKIYHPNCYHDFRGYYWTIFNNKESTEEYNHDKLSVSRQHTLRGIHGDNVTTKLITCVHGEVYCVAVDNRPDSETYQEWRWTMLSHSNRRQVVLPPGVGLGYLVMNESASMLYKWSYEGNYPDIDDQFTIKWNDPKIGISWPIKTPLIQERDA
jgi:dTDP-4-dehydrorhamnose 3,5-epimerase